MKITLSISARSSIASLFSIRDRNMEEATAYNAILARKGLVHENGPLPAHRLDPAPYLADPFYQTVKPERVSEGDWELFFSSYAPNEGFVYDELDISPKNFEEKTRFGYFASRFPFLTIIQHGQTWMSVTPHEINTMAQAVNDAHGNVVTFGLGMGYYAFMAAAKKNVSKVTVVEIDPVAIDIYHRFLERFFPNADKIQIWQGDGFSFPRKVMTKEHFDYAFVDMWHLPEDGLAMYLRMKTLEKYSPKTAWVYWVEPSLLSLLRRAVLILLEEEMAGSQDDDYDFAATPSDILINKLHKLLKKKILGSAEDVIDLLSDDSLRKIAVDLAY